MPAIKAFRHSFHFKSKLEHGSQDPRTKPAPLNWPNARPTRLNFN